MSNPNFHASTLTCEKNIGTQQGNGFQTCMPCFQCSLVVAVTASAQNSWTNIDVLWPGSWLMFDEFCCCRKVFIVQRRADFIFQLVVTFPQSMLLLASSICSSADSRLCGSLACGAPSFFHVLPLLLQLWQKCKEEIFFRTRSSYFWFLETIWSGWAERWIKTRAFCRPQC